MKTLLILAMLLAVACNNPVGSEDVSVTDTTYVTDTIISYREVTVTDTVFETDTINFLEITSPKTKLNGYWVDEATDYSISLFADGSVLFASENTTIFREFVVHYEYEVRVNLSDGTELSGFCTNDNLLLFGKFGDLEFSKEL